MIAVWFLVIVFFFYTKSCIFSFFLFGSTDWISESEPNSCRLEMEKISCQTIIMFLNCWAAARAWGNAKQSYCDVEIDASFVQVVGDVGRLHSHVGDVDGAGEQEEDGQAWQKQAENHRYGYIELSGGMEKKEKWGSGNSWCLQTLSCYHAFSEFCRADRQASLRLKQNTQDGLTSCLAGAVGRCTESEQQAGSLVLWGEQKTNETIGTV